jgi:hypothetical protein
MLGRNRRIEPMNIGSFEMSADFVNGTRQTYVEMRDSIRQSILMNKANPLGNTIDYFNEQEGLGAKIISSFLGKVATDASTLIKLGSIERRPAVLYQPAFDTVCSPGLRHRDQRNLDAGIGVRYLIVNSFPTIIEGIDDIQPGEIARISHARTWHQRPAFSTTKENPRIRLSIDI